MRKFSVRFFAIFAVSFWSSYAMAALPVYEPFNYTVQIDPTADKLINAGGGANQRQAPQARLSGDLPCRGQDLFTPVRLLAVHERGGVGGHQAILERQVSER